MFNGVRQLMEAIIKEKGIPFLDVVCYREHKEVLRDTVGSADGNEFLYMYSCSKPYRLMPSSSLADSVTV